MLSGNAADDAVILQTITRVLLRHDLPESWRAHRFEFDGLEGRVTWRALISWRETNGLDDIAQVPLRDLASCPAPPLLQHEGHVVLKLGWRPFAESRELRARYVHEAQRLIDHTAVLLENIAMPKAWPHASVAVPL